MIQFLHRRWFLLLLLGGTTVAWFFPRWVGAFTSWLEPRAVVAGALFLMAAGLHGRYLMDALVRPLPALWAVALSYGAVPVLGWLASGLLPSPDLRVGLFLMACVPCTLSSAVLWTRMAGGNEATALLAILLTTATSWLATTAWLLAVTGTSVAIHPAGLMRGLVVALLVPVVLGQLVRASAPVVRLLDRHRRLLGVLAQLLIFSMILRAVVEVSLRLREAAAAPSLGWFAAAAVVCVGTHLAALAGGLWSSRVLGFDRPSQIAVAFAGSQKTLPVALLLFHDYFKDDYPLAIVSVAFYHVGQLVVDTFIADRLARRPVPAAELPPLP